MAEIDYSLTAEEFKNGVRANGFIKDNNKYYNMDQATAKRNNIETDFYGISDCIPGRPNRAGANVLCNCVGLAWGAYHETWNKIDPTHTTFERVYAEYASGIIDSAKKHSFFSKYVIPVTDKPPLGGLIVWEDKHVAFIADVSADGNTIKIIQSGLNTPSWTQRNNANTGWVNDTRTITRNQNGTNHWYYRTNSGCLGFLANPGVVNNPDPPVEVTKYGVYIGDKFYGAHIYNGTKWVKATPKIYNGTKWVDCSE